MNVKIRGEEGGVKTRERRRSKIGDIIPLAPVAPSS